MEQQHTNKPTGPRTRYRPKEPNPITIKLTRLARKVLDAATARERESRSDVVEKLVRDHAARLRFPPREAAPDE